MSNIFACLKGSLWNSAGLATNKNITSSCISCYEALGISEILKVSNLEAGALITLVSQS